MKRQTRLADGDLNRSAKLILWVDTFNDHYTPEIAQAASDVLTSMGYRVEIPKKRLCCGRPLYDYGLLDEARDLLQRIISEFEDDIRAGVPVVGLEPGCLSVFKDEMLKQLPRSPLAKKLASQTYLFSDFVSESEFQWPQLDADVLLHGHCHQKSLFGMEGETALLDKIGVRWKLADSGCCGMAGSFGFNKDHYDLSMKIGEDSLLPIVRAADPNTIVVTDGFSCREQIEHGTNRKAMHIAQLLQKALRGH